jgi:hypothetical protein
MASSTTTQPVTLRDKLNEPSLGKFADALAQAPVGDALAILLDVSNPSTTVPATTVGAAVSQTGATVATASAATQTSSYVQADVQSIATLANALKVDYNKTIADVAALVAQVNALRVDDLALRAAAAAALAGTLGGATETSVTVTSNKAVLAQAPTPNGLFQVNATGGTTKGVKQLVMDPTATLITGQVYWDGGVNLTFAAIDAVSSCDLIYAKGDLSQKVSSLLQTVSP